MAENPHPLAAFREQQEPPLSQAALGEKLDPPVRDMTVSRWERRASIPRPQYLRQLEDLTGINMGDMIRACTPVDQSLSGNAA